MNEVITQKQFFSYIVTKQDYEPIITYGVTKDWFDETYGKQFDWLTNYYSKYNNVPNTIDYCSTFTDEEIIECGSIEAIVETLKLNKSQKEFANVLNTVRNKFMAGTLTAEQSKLIIADAGRKCASIAEEVSELKYTSNFDFLLGEFEDRQWNTDKHFFKSGLGELDTWFGGGWNKDSDYVAVCGRPGVGKSMLLCLFATKALQAGLTVAYYSGEMSAQMTVDRIISCDSKMSQSLIKQGNFSIRDQYATYVKSILPKYKLNLLTPHDLGDKYATALDLEIFCKKCGADILFIDQHSLMNDIEHARVSWEKAGNISRQIKALRDKLNIPVIMAVQQNRTKEENGEVTTAQVAGSDIIAQDCTKVIIITNPNADNIVKITVAKNRDGRSNVCQKYNLEYDTVTFTPFIEGEEEEEKIF